MSKKNKIATYNYFLTGFANFWDWRLESDLPDPGGTSRVLIEEVSYTFPDFRSFVESFSVGEVCTDDLHSPCANVVAPVGELGLGLKA